MRTLISATVVDNIILRIEKEYYTFNVTVYDRTKKTHEILASFITEQRAEEYAHEFGKYFRDINSTDFIHSTN